MTFTAPYEAFNLRIKDRQANSYDENIISIMKAMLDHFNGYHYIFKAIKTIRTNSRANVKNYPSEHYITALRVQYLYLFILHFPINAPKSCLRMKVVYKEFKAKIVILGKQIKNPKHFIYIATLNRLIHLTEVLASMMYECRIPWYGCFKCGTPFDDLTWNINPVIKCLSEAQKAPINVVAHYVGIPSECQCFSNALHSLDGDYYVKMNDRCTNDFRN